MRVFTDYGRARDAHAPTAGHELAARVRENLAAVATTIAIASGKGGSGKSVIAVNVAAALALKGKKVAIVDADLNSPSVMRMLGMKPPRSLPMLEGIEPAAGPHGLRVLSGEMIPGGEPPPISFLDDIQDSGATAVEPPVEMDYAEALARMLAQSRLGALDFLILDVAPGVARFHELESIVRPQATVFVSHPSAQGAAATRNAIRLAERAGTRVIGLVENMAGFICDGCRSVRPLMPEGNLAAVASEFKIPVIARMPFDPRLAEASDRGVIFVHEFADTPIAKTLAAIAQTIDRASMGPRRDTVAGA